MKIVLVIIIALILRIFLLPTVIHVDMLSLAGWGEWIYKFGPMGFYKNEIWIYSWPTQSPLANIVFWLDFEFYKKIGDLFVLIASTIANYRLLPTKFLWWFDFVKWFGGSFYKDTPLLFGYLLTIKFIAVLADLSLALIIFLISKSFDKRKAVLFSAIYLFSPFSFYLSAIWGQYDQVGFLFALLSFIFLQKKWLYFAPIIFLVSILLKPTFLVFTPLFLYLYFKNKPNIIHLIFGFFSSFLFFIYTTAIFNDKNLYEFITKDLVRLVFYKAEFRVSTHSFNFWHILIGNKAMHQDSLFLFLPAKIWGWGIFMFLNILAFKITRHLTRENLIKALFLVGAGGWLFLTNMMERYFFAGVVSGLLLSVFYPKIFKYWLVMSIIFWINLYESWWFPAWLEPLRLILIWQDGFVTRLLSLINVFIFIKIMWLVYPEIQTFFKKWFNKLIRFIDSNH